MNLSLTMSGHLKLDSSEVKYEYRSGASYYGSLKERKRSGRGVFRWPNGSCYEGHFVDNKRHGEGKQEWPDRSSYVGDFNNDIREGYGRHTWCNDELYKGAYLNDKRHGKGVYYWPDGTKYEGYFYNDLKDGFGTFMFANGKRFEGLYKNNERSGPGIFSYCDGRQDVGIWQGEKLIKLCSVMENSFLFQHFSDYYVNAGENLPMKVRRANSALSVARNVGGEDKNYTEPSYGNPEGRNKVSMSSQIPTSFPYTDIVEGIRSPMHGPKGLCEEASEEFICVAGKGDCVRVTELLEEGLVHVDVADKTGFTSLLAASVNCHKDVINCLLDYGADINKLNCEGLSALAACHVLFYTKHTWKGNIAETLPEENVFNSVQWNISSGTFVQRKNRGSLSLIKPQVSESESQFSLDTPNVMSQEYLGKSFSHIEIDGSKLGNVSDLTVCRIDKGNRDGKKYTETTGYSGSKNQDKNSKFINGQHKRSSENEEDGSNFKNETNEKCMENLCSGRDIEYEDRSGLDNVSGNIDQISTSLVDKNIFIHEFLNRTASAMSNRNSSVSHEKVQSVLDNSLDNKKLVTTDVKSENSDALLEENNIKNTVEKVGSSELAVISYEPPGSLQYSVLSAIGSSQQTSTYLEASDGLNILEQNRQKLLTQQRRPHLEATVRLLLKRGADPNASSLPMPVLFFAVKAADSAAVEILLDKGASTDARLPTEKLGISPLHIAVALPSNAVTITELLLKAGADPDMRDRAFGEKEAGRTPLHIACSREGYDVEANHVISLLLHYKADPNLLCKGHSALSLAIASGNDIAVETLLKNHANPSLSLTHGVGSALCAAVSFSAERRRKIVDRIRLVNKLMRNGANILAPIIVSNEHPPGTVVDYAYHVFYQDHRIAHTPYHALTSYEREIYNARRRMLDHLAELLRTHVLKKEKKLLEEHLTRRKELRNGSPGKLDKEIPDRTVSFYFDDSGKGLRDTNVESSLEKVSLTEENVSTYLSSDTRLLDCGLRVAVVHTPSDHMNVSRLSMSSSKKLELVRKNRFRYCYECGRSVGVRLSACTRCKEVFYCSRNCKLKAWNARHKVECVRLSDTSKSNLSRRSDSPTPVTNPDQNNTPLKNPSDRNIKKRNSRNRFIVSSETSIKNSFSGHTSKSAASL